MAGRAIRSKGKRFRRELVTHGSTVRRNRERVKSCQGSSRDYDLKKTP